MSYITMYTYRNYQLKMDVPTDEGRGISYDRKRAHVALYHRGELIIPHIYLDNVYGSVSSREAREYRDILDEVTAKAREWTALYDQYVNRAKERLR